MYRTMLKSKIHRATVTHADLQYEGSVTVDANLLEMADIVPNEFVNIWNITNGNRIETYALVGEAGSGVIAINGAAARLFAPGDLVIIASKVTVSEDRVREHSPKLVFVDAKNRPTKRVGPEIPGPDLPPRG